MTGFVFCDCSMVVGYTGYFCDIDINECLDGSSECQNGGQCINVAGGYECLCTNTGFEGQYCERETDECAQSDNCLNNGICENTFGNFTCYCENTGFSGWRCEHDLNECELQVTHCQNNGICLNNEGSYTCNCQDTGFIGDNCETGELS